MRPFRLSAAALLAMGTLGGLTATAASAATTTPVMFTDVAASQTTITYGNNTVTITGYVDEAVEHPGGFIPGTPVSGMPVSIEPASNGTVLGTATTDSTGYFTATATLPKGEVIRAVTGTDAPYGYAASQLLDIQAQAAPTSITMGAMPAIMFTPGKNFSFTGTVQVNDNGTEEALGGAPVELDFNGDPTGVTATTDDSGNFTLTATDITTSGQWTVQVDPPGGESLYGASTSHAVALPLAYTTRTQGFSVPATAEAHNGEKIGGTVQQYNGSSWVPATGVTYATVYVRNGTTGSWSNKGNIAVSSEGTFAASLQLAPGLKQVQVRVPQQGTGSEYAATGTSVKIVKVYDQTCFTGTSVSHSNGRTLVSGRVIDWCGSKSQSFETVTGYAQVYYRKGTSGAWAHLGSAKLGQGGTFAYTKYSTLHGYFYVTYPAQGYFLASASAIHHIS